MVDLGSGDGRALVELALRTGCRAIGVEASGQLVARSRALSRASGVADRVVFLHELIGLRGLRGASLVYCWLLPGSAELVKALVGEVLAAGGDLLRGLVVVGESAISVLSALASWSARFPIRDVSAVMRV